MPYFLANWVQALWFPVARHPHNDDNSVTCVVILLLSSILSSLGVNIVDFIIFNLQYLSYESPEVLQ